MYSDRLLTPPTTFLARPLEYRTPVPGGDSLDVHLSGYEDVDRLHLQRFVSALGGRVSDTFERRRTHLVLADGSSLDGIKPRKAREWGVAIWSRAELEAFGREQARKRDEAVELVVAEEDEPSAKQGPLVGCTCLLSSKLKVRCLHLSPHSS